MYVRANTLHTDGSANNDDLALSVLRPSRFAGGRVYIIAVSAVSAVVLASFNSPPRCPYRRMALEQQREVQREKTGREAPKWRERMKAQIRRFGIEMCRGRDADRDPERKREGRGGEAQGVLEYVWPCVGR